MDDIITKMDKWRFTAEKGSKSSKVITIGDCMFPKRKSAPIFSSGEMEERIQNSVVTGMLRMYMNPHTYDIRVDDDFTHKIEERISNAATNRRYYADQIHGYITRIAPKLKTIDPNGTIISTYFRIIENDSVYIIAINGLKDDIVNRQIVLMYMLNSRYPFCRARYMQVEVSRKGEVQFQDMTDGPVFYALDKAVTQDYIAKTFSNAHPVDMISTYELVLMERLFHTICRNMPVDYDPYVKSIPYTDIEMSVIKQILSRVPDEYDMFASDCRFHMSHQYMTDIELNRRGIVVGEPHIDFRQLAQLRDAIEDNIPIVDMDDEDDQFIWDYAYEHGLITSGRDDVPTTTGIDSYDMITYAMSNPYGDTFIMTFPINDEIEERFIIRLVVTENARDLDVYLINIDRITDRIIPACVVRLFDAHKYHSIETQPLYINEGNIQYKPAGLDNDLRAYLDAVCPLFKSDHRIGSIVTYILTLYKLMNDRPEKLRMVRRIQRLSPDDRYFDPTMTADEMEEDDGIVITRILKTARSAATYVREMNEYSTRRHLMYEYVLEHWPRRGHWRRLPHSEKKVWIPPTICHRHKALTDKEIHIQLGL